MRVLLEVGGDEEDVPQAVAARRSRGAAAPTPGMVSSASTSSTGVGPPVNVHTLARPKPVSRSSPARVAPRAVRQHVGLQVDDRAVARREQAVLLRERRQVALPLVEEAVVDAACRPCRSPSSARRSGAARRRRRRAFGGRCRLVERRVDGRGAARRRSSRKRPGIVRRTGRCVRVMGECIRSWSPTPVKGRGRATAGAAAAAGTACGRAAGRWLSAITRRPRCQACA